MENKERFPNPVDKFKFNWYHPDLMEKKNVLNLAGPKELMDKLMISVLKKYEKRMKVVSARVSVNGKIVDIFFNMDMIKQDEAMDILKKLHKFNKGRNIKDVYKNRELQNEIIQWVWWMESGMYVSEVEEVDE